MTNAENVSVDYRKMLGSSSRKEYAHRTGTKRMSYPNQIKIPPPRVHDLHDSVQKEIGG